MTVTDHETTVLDDLDFEIPCDQADCSDAAEWIARLLGLSCCVPVRLLCDAHLEDRRWKQRHALGWVCTEHGSVAARERCRIDAEPLNPS